jgi:hypothetical protein
MKFLFLLSTTLLLARTTCGARETSKYNVNGLNVYASASMSSSDGCSYASVDVYASETVEKSTRSTTPQTYAYASVYSYNSCEGFSKSTSFKIASPNLKGSLTKGVTLTAKASSGYECTQGPEFCGYSCEDVPVEGSFSVVLTPMGPFSKSCSNYQFSTPAFRFRDRSTGTYVDATCPSLLPKAMGPLASPPLDRSPSPRLRLYWNCHFNSWNETWEFCVIHPLQHDLYLHLVMECILRNSSLHRHHTIRATLKD